MENFLKYLFGLGVIVWCLFAFNFDSSFLLTVLPIVIFILIIGGSVFAVGYALGETLKFRKEVEMDEVNEMIKTENEKQ